ncbi:MAG: hypothetical protein SFY80_09465 [Verrucomicrobiota bacterium]|nr:hypothetical protein [Verrucomicrobiota bacterium]
MPLEPSMARPARTTNTLQLYFSNKALVKSILTDESGKEWMTGVKDHEIRWQQGTMAICILLLHTKITHLLELPEESGYIAGDRGSPARSLDNLLNKPGDWAVQMFGEKNGFAAIRNYIYRRKTVTRNNTISELCWDNSHLPASAIAVHLQNELCTDWNELVEVLKNLCDEYSPENGLEYWEEMKRTYSSKTGKEKADDGKEITDAETIAHPRIAAIPVNLPTIPVNLPAATPVATGASIATLPVTAPAALPAAAPVAPAALPSPITQEIGQPVSLWPNLRTRVMLFAALLIFLGLATLLYSTKTRVAPTQPALIQDEALGVIEQFYDMINDNEFATAYTLTTERFKKEYSQERFTRYFGRRRYEDIRILGDPDNLRNGKQKRTYHLVSTLITQARLIPELAGIGQLSLGQIDNYNARIATFRENMRKLGVPDASIDALGRKQIERLDLSIYLTDRLGVKDEALATLYPTVVTVETTLRKLLHLRWDDSSRRWQYDSSSDYEDTLAIPR